MHLELDWELLCFKQEAVLAVTRMKLKTTAYADPLHLLANLTRAEKRYSNIEREALGILYVLEKFHHYCFAREVSTDHTYSVITLYFTLLDHTYIYLQITNH